MPPKIYTLNCQRILGTIGPETFEVEQPVCSVCNRTIMTEIKYSSFEYVFDEYDGEDMFAASGAIVITQNLYEALYAGKILGFAPIKVQAKKSKYFEGSLGKLPPLFYMGIMPPDVRNIPIGYNVKGECPKCKMPIIDSDSFNMELMFRERETDKAHLQVFANSWNNTDVFSFQDHAEIGITERFLTIIREFNCPENVVIPADWI